MKKLLYIFVFLLIGGMTLVYFGYKLVMGPSVSISEENQYLYLSTGATFDDLRNTLIEENIISSLKGFDLTAKLMKYDEGTIRTGRFKLENGWSNRELISFLRIGKQAPVKVTFNNLRSIDQLAGQVASYLEVDSITLYEFFKNPQVQFQYNLSDTSFLTAFIPNTYEFFWNTPKEKILSRLVNESEKFWENNERSKKAANLELSKREVYALASIVEKESIRNDEKPRIAGVYINRIKSGIALQADPTVVFAVGDFGLRRVLNKHLAFDSPYNTYMYPGIPPGPICMPSIASIDAVLNYENHDYLYFCAKPESNGGHLFATDLRQHNANAAVYHRWLNTRGIN